MTNATWSLLAVFCCLSLVATALVSGAETKPPVCQFVPDENGMVLRMPDGRVVFSYMTRKPAASNLTANSVCCLYPVNAPSGTRVVDFAPGDHRHHRGVFLAWHTMNCGEQRADFWGWGEMSPTENRVIRNRDLKLVSAADRSAKIAVHNDWCIGDEVVIQESLAIGVQEKEGVFVIDLAFDLLPQCDVQLNQTAFGGFCVKSRKEGKAVYSNSAGEVKLPNPHHLKPETDWPSAAWYDYTVQLDEGRTVGIAVIDHNQNPPSTWHNLEPIAMVNPCIVAPGPVAVKKGQPLALKYRLVVHDGPANRRLLDALAKDFRTP